MSARGADRVLRTLAGRGLGVVARWQLLAAGVSAWLIDDRVRRGHLLVLHPGVYAVGHRALRREAWWLAAALACGPHGVASHASAGGVWGLLADNGSSVHVTVPGRGGRRRGIVIHRSRNAHAADVTRHEGIPVTSVARTLLDVAATRPRLLARAVEQAEVLDLLDLGAIDDLLVRSHRAPRGAAISSSPSPITSPGTSHSRRVRSRRTSLRSSPRPGLPAPAVEARVEGHRVDFLWRQQRVVVEADGWRYHRTRAAFERDRGRDRALTFAGYRVTPLHASRSPRGRRRGADRTCRAAGRLRARHERSVTGRLCPGTPLGRWTRSPRISPVG